jgi:hypothetical protein
LPAIKEASEVKTQGTQLYTVDPDDDSILRIVCITSVNGLDSSIDQNETTCLDDTARTYEAGLATPGTGTFGVRPNPQEDSHVRLYELKKLGTSLKWALGWSDGKDIAPTGVDSDGNLILPTTRTWLTFEGFMNAFPFDFAQNSQVESQVGVQISGDPDWIPKA